MKQFTRMGLLGALFMLLIACEKDQDLNPNPDFSGNLTPVFKMKVDGQGFDTREVKASFFQGNISLAAFLGNQRLSFLIDEQRPGAYPANASGSNFLQYEADTTKVNQLYSTFFSTKPKASINITKIDRSNKTIAGNFNGTLHQSFIFGLNDSVVITEGEFRNIPYIEVGGTVFNFGSIEYKENDTLVTMNTATITKHKGAVNADVYDYFNISSATADFVKSISIEIDDSRFRVGTKTYFYKEHADPFSNISVDSLATVYLTNGNFSYEPSSGFVMVEKIEEINGEQKVSGSFEFEGKEEFGTATVTVTEGKFEGIIRK